MTVSLIVATKGRSAELARLLRSLEKQTFKRFRVVIVDQNPPGFLAEIIARYEGIVEMEVVASEDGGVSSARNLGLERVSGDIVAFPDDDCWYAPNTIDRVVRMFAETPETGGLIVSWGEKPPSEPSVYSLKPVNRFGAFRNAGTLVQFYRREALEGVWFDPSLGPGTGLPYGCGEDTDFLLQMLQKGAKIQRTSELLVYHPEPDISDRRLTPKTYAYARGRMYLLRKHGFPIWFQVANILYPLGRLASEGSRAWNYRTAMFLGRLKSFWQS